MSDDAEQFEHHGVIGGLGEDGPVHLGGLVQQSALMMLQGQAEEVGHGDRPGVGWASTATWPLIVGGSSEQR